MSPKMKIGDRIIIQLTNSRVFEADFVHQSTDRVDVKNIVRYETDTKIDSPMSFYRQEIKSMYALKDKTENKNEPSVNGVEKENGTNKNCVAMDREEFDRLKNISNNYIYIKLIDDDYYKAVEDLINFESVGVLAIGSEQGRCGKITIMVLSTWKQVYVFDFKLYRTKQVLPEIKEILESTYITKVVHGGGPLRDCLHYSHQIQMVNVFDTQVADLTLIKNKIGKCPEQLRNISECLMTHFNFPSSLLQTSIDALSESWEERPLEDDKIFKLSRLTTYLIPLKDHLMNTMMGDFFNAVDKFHNLFIDSSTFQMKTLASDNKLTEKMENIVPADLLKMNTGGESKLD